MRCRHSAVRRPLCAAALLAAFALPAGAAGPAPSRGELLYATHCIQCHNEQIHWRERKLARDWPSLRVEVDRWQRQARLGWSEADIDEVTRHLGEMVYEFPARRPTARAGSGQRPTVIGRAVARRAV